MYTFILIVDESNKPQQAGDFLKTLGVVEDQADGRFMVAGEGGMEDGWIAITCDNSIFDDYESDELKKINASIGDPCFFMVEGRDTLTNFANEFILDFDGSIDALIDNDHGLIADMDTIKNLAHRKENWLHKTF
jgi:hypothetical protein